MSSLPTLPVNIRHVAWQFARRAPLDAAQFLYGEIAQRMLQRLSYIRVSPDLLLDAGCGAGHAIEPLRARYPAAGYMGVDHCATLLDVARARHAGKRGLWNRLRNNPVPKTEFMCADMATIPLPPEQAEHNLQWLRSRSTGGAATSGSGAASPSPATDTARTWNSLQGG